MKSTAIAGAASLGREVDDLASFRKLHGQKREGTLSQEAAAEYRSAVDRLLARSLAEQERDHPRGGRRRTPRIRRAVPVEIRWATGSVRVFTRDLGLGGFSVLAHAAFPEDVLFATVNIRRNAFVRAQVRVVKSVRARGCVQVSCAFTDVPELDTARLKDYVVEELCNLHRSEEWCSR